MNIELNGKSVTISGYKGGVSVGIDEVEVSDVLGFFDLDDICSHFDEKKILDYIGKERVMEYFDLINNPE